MKKMELFITFSIAHEGQSLLIWGEAKKNAIPRNMVIWEE